jgi:hypothetical protein
VALGACGHVVCCACALQTVRAAMTPDRLGLPCPLCVAVGPRAGGGGGARGAAATPLIDHSAIATVHRWSVRPGAPLPDGVRPLSDEEVRRFETMMVELALSAAGSAERRLRCPNPSCACLVLAAPLAAGAAARSTACPYCRTRLCEVCGRVWASHEGRTCAEAEAAARAAPELAALVSAQGASFKPCPGCGTGITHYRGHACHHITPGVPGGCPSCHTHFCCVCLTVMPEGRRGPCGEGCPRFCSDECDCPDCPDCRPGHACPHCSGPSGCRVCAGETVSDRAARVERQAAARARKMAGGWRGPRTTMLVDGGTRVGAEGAEPRVVAAAAGAAGAGGAGAVAGGPPPRPALDRPVYHRLALPPVAGAAGAGVAAGAGAGAAGAPLRGAAANPGAGAPAAVQRPGKCTVM